MVDVDEQFGGRIRDACGSPAAPTAKFCAECAARLEPLESSTPANNHRYERHGFAKVGEFFPPGSDIAVTTMGATRAS